MTIYRIKEIWRYPVKSMQGEMLDRCELTSGGVPLDRGWAVRDEKTQTIRGAKWIAGLMLCSARYIEGTDAGLVPHVEIALPDGGRVRSDDPGVNDRLSRALDHSVTLWPLRPTDDVDHYRFKGLMTGSMDEEMSAMFALSLIPGQPIPDLSKIPPALLAEVSQFASPRGTYFDLYPVHLLTGASLRHIQSLAPESVIDVRRFRPNFLIDDDSGDADPVETAWLDRDARIGVAKLRIDIKTMRCIMTTREQPGLPRDGAVLRAMMRQTEQCLGVYANVVQGGAVTVGDDFRLG